MNVYENDELVGELTRQQVEKGNSILQVHMLDRLPAIHCHKLLRYANPAPYDLILDVGCGIGHVPWYMRGFRPDLRFMLQNISQAQLDMCPPEFFRIKGNMCDIACEDGAFNGVMLNYSMGHADDIYALFDEMERIVKPGGWVSIWDLEGWSNKVLEEFDYQTFSYPALLDIVESRDFNIEKMHFPRHTTTEHLSAEDLSPFEGLRPVYYLFRRTA